MHYLSVQLNVDSRKERAYQKGLDRNAMIDSDLCERPGRRAAKIIASVERCGGFILNCGCLIHASANELRRYMAWTSPEEVIHLALFITSDMCHSCPVKLVHANI